MDRQRGGHTVKGHSVQDSNWGRLQRGLRDCSTLCPTGHPKVVHAFYMQQQIDTTCRSHSDVKNKNIDFLCVVYMVVLSDVHYAMLSVVILRKGEEKKKFLKNVVNSVIWYFHFLLHSGST